MRVNALTLEGVHSLETFSAHISSTRSSFRTPISFAFVSASDQLVAQADKKKTRTSRVRTQEEYLSPAGRLRRPERSQSRKSRHRQTCLTSRSVKTLFLSRRQVDDHPHRLLLETRFAGATHHRLGRVRRDIQSAYVRAFLGIASARTRMPVIASEAAYGFRRHR